MLKLNLALASGLLLLAGFGCAASTENGSTPSNGASSTTIENGSTQGSTPTTDKTRVMFSLNVHDFVDPDESFATISKVIDIHEKYSVPVDIYLTDEMTRLIEKTSPSLLSRLKTSKVVAVNYHVRPPSPYYSGFDYIGLAGMDSVTLTKTLLSYEEHAIDLTTGKVTAEAGGYQHLKDLLGYAPRIVSPMTTNAFLPTLAKIYKDKGAEFIVSHDVSAKLGDKTNNLLQRPEQVELKVLDEDKQSASTVLESARTEAGAGGFIGIKAHETDFYSIFIPWTPIYFTDQTDKTPKAPPYDLSLSKLTARPQASEDTAWAWYEAAVSYLSMHTSTYDTVNAIGLESLAGLK